VRISGFGIARNALLMGYPVVESITSILPLVDEFVIGIGQSDDDTEGLVRSIGDPKIRIFQSFWDTSNQSGGRILSEKTNEALERCTGDWCFYLQSDEVVHERDLPVIREACAQSLNDERVEGLLFQYVHFYGSYSVIGTARNWYRNEVRIVRRAADVRSVGDAQGFRVGDRKPRVRASGARIYHYGWAKHPGQMGQKKKMIARWWGVNVEDADRFRYRSMYGLRSFRGAHPAVMQKLVAAQDWTFEPRVNPLEWDKRDYKNCLSGIVEGLTGKRIGERRNYELIA
jgi:hypothetical protein